jgi:hypothetical protein
MITYFYALTIYFNYYENYYDKCTTPTPPCEELLNCFFYIIDKTWKVNKINNFSKMVASQYTTQI